MVEGPSRRRILSGTGLVAGAGLAGCLGIFEGDAGQTDGDGEAFPEPGRTITGIVPFGVGGGTDTFVRQLFEVLRNRYDVNTQVENIEGAGGLRGVGEGYKRDPDGYTIVFHNPPSTPLAEMLNPQDFDLTEFEAIAQYGVSPRVIGANSELGIESPEDLLGRYEDELTDAGGQGTANISEVSWHVFRENWGWDWDNYIPYPSAGELTTAIARGKYPVDPIVMPLLKN
jgi:tripartite-type tricarboxylate transporter receptor subunit TctC